MLNIFRMVFIFPRSFELEPKGFFVVVIYTWGQKANNTIWVNLVLPSCRHAWPQSISDLWPLTIPEGTNDD